MDIKAKQRLIWNMLQNCLLVRFNKAVSDCESCRAEKDRMRDDLEGLL